MMAVSWRAVFMRSFVRQLAIQPVGVGPERVRMTLRNGTCRDLRPNFLNCSMKSTDYPTLAERNGLLFVLAKLLRKSRRENWRREWDSNPR
jgi:hypothetical protein